MKKLIKVILVSIFTCFSFYYTDRVVEFFKMRDPLMKKINEVKEQEEVLFVNGTLTSQTMLVGSSGFIVDVNTSYEKMKRLDEFNKDLLEYISVKPTITKKDNLDKLIVGKNTSLKEISLVFVIDDFNLFEQVAYILKEREVSSTFFIDGFILKNNFTLIKSLLNESNSTIGFYGYNGKYDDVSMRYVKGFFKDNISYSNYCLYTNNNFLETCSRYKINTIRPIILSSNIYSFMKNNKKNGYIYQIDVNKVNIKELNTMIIYLKQKGYSIININELLKE